MKINSISGYSFRDETKQKSNLKPFIYPLLSGTGALIGYSIKLQDIDGPDIISPIRGGLATKMKTKVPNIIGKWKNALAGAFIGTGIAMILDFIITKNYNNKTPKQASEK